VVRGENEKQQHREAHGKQKSPCLQKRNLLLNAISRRPAMSEETAASLSSEFDIFASKPVQSSVLETTEVAYKPIASVEQSDLEFLIPADNDTYIDLNIKLYIRGKLVKEDGKDLNAIDHTAVTNNLLHSLFSQCNVTLNGVSITQASELYLYRSELETNLIYGTDAASSHLTNVFWYLDDSDLLSCDPTAADAKIKDS
jgi:hypothetical protein